MRCCAKMEAYLRCLRSLGGVSNVDRLTLQVGRRFPAIYSVHTCHIDVFDVFEKRRGAVRKYYGSVLTCAQRCRDGGVLSKEFGS